MSDLPSVRTKISVESTQYRSAVSEFLIQTIGRTINWILDDLLTLRTEVSGKIVAVTQGPTGNEGGQSVIRYTPPTGYRLIGQLTATAGTNNNATLSLTVSGSNGITGDFNGTLITPGVSTDPGVQLYARGSSGSTIKLYLTGFLIKL